MRDVTPNRTGPTRDLELLFHRRSTVTDNIWCKSSRFDSTLDKHGSRQRHIESIGVIFV